MEGPAPSTLIRDLRLFIFLTIAAAALVILYLDERKGLDLNEARAQDFEERLVHARDIVRQNADLLIPVREKILNPMILAEKSLRTVVMEAAEQTGIAPNLESIDPSEDKKMGVYRARLSLGNVPVRQIVAFIVALKNVSAGIHDTEATMRMQGYNQDVWRLDLTIEAPLGAGAAKGHAAK